MHTRPPLQSRARDSGPSDSQDSTGEARRRISRSPAIACALLTAATVGAARAEAQTSATASSQRRLTLQRLLDPATRVETDGRLVRFAIHSLINFETLADLFQYIDRESGRWQFATSAARQAFGDDLLRRGVESRVVSMESELPLEILLTHTRAEVERAVAAIWSPQAPAMFRSRNWELR